MSSSDAVKTERGETGPGGSAYPDTPTGTSIVPGLGGDDFPRNNQARMSDFGKRTKGMGKMLVSLSMSRARQPVDPQHREMMRQWIIEARNHTIDPEAFDVELVDGDRPLDYHTLFLIYRQQSELVREFDV